VPPGSWTIKVTEGELFVDGQHVVASRGGDGVTALYENYGDQYSQGETLVIGDGEYLQVESDSHKVSISWTSQIPLGDLVGLLRRYPGQFIETNTGDESFVQYLNSETGTIDLAQGDVKSVLDFIVEATPDARYVSLQFESSTVAWMPPAQRIKGSKEEYSEVALVLNTFDKDLFDSIVEITATKNMRNTYLTLMAGIKQLSD